MRIGCCIPGQEIFYQGRETSGALDRILTGYEIIRKIGYDYAEAPLAAIAGLSEKEFESLLEKKEQGEFLIEACNVFLPGEYRITNPEQQANLEQYVEEALRRASLLGVRIVVFGSGKVRTVSSERAAEDVAAIEEFLRMSNEKARKYDLVIVIEPLNREESNIFNTVSAAASMTRKLSLSNIRLLADSHHTAKEQENLFTLVENADQLTHVHIAEAPDRSYPGKNGGEYLREFSSFLHQAGYQNRVSVECRFEDFEKEMEAAYPFVREYFS